MSKKPILPINDAMDRRAAENGLAHWTCIDPSGNLKWQRCDAVVLLPKFNAWSGNVFDELRKYDDDHPLGDPLTVLNSLRKAMLEASDERYQKMQDAYAEAEKWKSQGDDYGYNFHQGMAGGMNWADIVYGRVIRALDGLCHNGGPIARMIRDQEKIQEMANQNFSDLCKIKEMVRDPDTLFASQLECAAAISVRELQAEVDRLKAGKFTADEIHGVCHNLHGTVDARAFADGCAAEQRKLYGCAPDADSLASTHKSNQRFAEAFAKIHEENQRLTAALHAGRCHPDYTYIVHPKGSPGIEWGLHGFELCPECVTLAPGDTCWRRKTHQ